MLRIFINVYDFNFPSSKDFILHLLLIPFIFIHLINFKYHGSQTKSFMLPWLQIKSFNSLDVLKLEQTKVAPSTYQNFLGPQC